jgi:hypothetical protein
MRKKKVVLREARARPKKKETFIKTGAIFVS